MRAAAVALVCFAISAYAAGRQPPKVVAIHPGADVVPENLLRFYVDFSEPMQGGDAFEHLRLVDKDGPVKDAFREIELWSRDNRRLMVYIHPGRIKRGLEYRGSLGPVLREGETFVLEVVPGMVSRDGRPMVAPASKTFRAGAADREKPDLGRWTYGRGVLEVDEWLDQAGLEEFVTLDGQTPRRVTGRRLEFGQRGTERTENGGAHRLVVDARLEDLAGNSFRRRFETRASEPELELEQVERRLSD